MARETAGRRACTFCEVSAVENLDITGGAPELHPALPRAGARGARARRARHRPLQPHRPGRARAGGPRRSSSPRNEVEIIASLPCYTEELVDRQRGKGVFETSIAGAAAAERARLRQPRLGLARTWSTTRRARRCRRRRTSSRPTTSAMLGEQLRHRVQPPVHARQHADPALRLARSSRKGQFNDYMELLHDAHRDENLDGGDVPHAGLGRLAGLRLRLRLQPDAGPAAAREAASRVRTCAT